MKPQTKEKVTNSNVNTNNNNIKVDVKVEHPKKRAYNRKKKPNWILKAIVLALIGLAITLILNYIMSDKGGEGKPAVIEDRSTQIQPNN